MADHRERVERELHLPRDALALIDETVERAREEFQDPGIDRQRVLELLACSGGRWTLIPGEGGH